MKVGDYVALLGAPGEKIVPLGIIVSRPEGGASWFWDVLISCGGIESFNENYLVVCDDI